VDMDYLFKLGTAHNIYTHFGALDWKFQDFYSEFGKSVDQFIINTKEPRIRLIGKYLEKATRNSVTNTDGLPPSDEIRTLLSSNYQVARSENDPKKRWVDGTPENTFYMYSLSHMFPKAKFIHLLRDPFEVVASLSKFSNAGAVGKDYPIKEAFSTWSRLVNYAVLGEKALGAKKVLRVHFHDLVKDKENTLKKVLEFIEDDYHPDCLLPLDQKINSSKVEEDMDRAKEFEKYGVEAKKMYAEICASSALSVEPDQNALENLETHFRSYAEALQDKMNT